MSGRAIVKDSSREEVTRRYPQNPCHRFGFAMGGQIPTLTHTQQTHTRLPGGFCQPVVIPSQGLSPFHSSFMSHLVYQIQVSGQQIEYFEKLQLQCKITEPLRIPLHSNIQWGSVHHMLDHSYRLCQASKTSVVSTDLNTETPCT